MAIWRADADGANPKQLTFDTEYRAWFPHISPDSRYVAFVSYRLVR